MFARRAYLLFLLLFGCDDATTEAAAEADAAPEIDAAFIADAAPPDAAPDAGAPPGTTPRFELSFDREDPAAFFSFPYPSDLRRTPSGGPDLRALPIPATVTLVTGLREIALDRPGFPTTPVAWFAFTDALAPHDPETVVPAEVDAPLLLVDVDPESPDRGALTPVVAQTLAADPYVPEHVLGVAPVPGFVLAPERTYAFVVRTALRDATGARIGAAPGLVEVAAGADGEAAALYAPLWSTLEQIGVPADEVAVATVFTTGDVVADTWALTERVRASHQPRIRDLRLDPSDGLAHARYCELHGTLDVPEFQRGEPPYDRDGVFEFDEAGDPIVQRTTAIPVVITLPRAEMPADGFPLVMYFHGSGGVSQQLVDRGPIERPGGPPRVGEGPAHELAGHGFAAAGSAHPVNPERLPGASGIAYLNLRNLKAFRDTFRQGIIEQRLYLDALLALEIAPDLLADCEGTSTGGAAVYFFDPEPVMAMGQSMGGMYANLVGAVEPRIKAVVPTGAGGFWSFFILNTTLIPNVKNLVRTAIRADASFSWLHPALHLLQTGWEAAEPMVSMPRLGHRPLPEQPVRPVYEPVGRDDVFFPTAIFDAMALAYRHRQAGEEIWPEMQARLALAELDGFEPYPVRQNMTSVDGTPYTSAVVQYEGDGIDDPHVIFVQLEAVRHQYGCFFATFFETGVAEIPAPDAPCR